MSSSLQDVGTDAFIETLGAEPKVEDESSDQSEDTEDIKETKASEDAESSEKTDEDSKTDSKSDSDSVDWEARFKGQQAEWTKEHQAKLDLQVELDLLKTKTAAPVDDQGDKEQADWLASFREAAEDDPVGATEEAFKNQQKMFDSIKEENKKLQELIYSQKLALQEDQMRDLHEDYDEMIEKVLVPAWDKYPELKAQWSEKGGTAKVGYEMAKKIKQSSEILSDPEAYEKNLRDKIAEENKTGNGSSSNSGNGSREAPKTLSGVNSQSAVPPGRVNASGNSNALKGFFAGIEQEKQKRFS